jgi:hypothetical protein
VLLRDVHIVDTPGSNAVFREHYRITAEFVPRSDFVLFVTSADRPFTESERLFLSAVRDWGKTVVIVLNKIDILGTPAEVDTVVAFVRNAARELLGYQPDVVPLSSRLAARAKQGDPTQWAASRFEAFERFLLDRIDAPSRFRLKLANPLGQRGSPEVAGIAGRRLALMEGTGRSSPTSNGSGCSTARTWRAGSSCAWAPSKRCSPTWKCAATVTSKTRSGSGASSTCSTARASRRTSKRSSSPTRRRRSSAPSTT